MSNIKFYIPEGESIPTDLCLYVEGIFVKYERIKSGFRFHIDTLDENKAIEIAKKITDVIRFEKDESEHGVTWVTLSLSIIEQDERYRVNTIVDWKYRVRDSY